MNTVIESGIIKKNNNENIKYHMILLDESYLTDVMYLQEKIIHEVNNSHLYDPVTLDSMKKRFMREGRIIGAFSDHRIIAFRVIHFPPHGDDNFGIDIDLPEDELHKVAHLAATVVHPAYRGNSLAFKMNMHAIKIIRDLDYCHLCSTVSPSNYANIVTLFKTGLIIKEVKEKYGGKLRYIFYQNLSNPITMKTKEEINIRIDDIYNQKKLLWKGYYGYKINRNDTKFEIIYSN